MFETVTPNWVWGFVAIGILLPFLALALLFIRERLGAKPLKTLEMGDTTIELWVKEHAYPSQGEAIIAPVAPDLEMAAGIAKWVRDATADRIQTEADAAAPLQPGDAFVGSGGKYKFAVGALAVVMDNMKRTTPEWIAEGVRRAIILCNEAGARTVIIPDMTEDLLRQPAEISDAQRRETCGPIARAMIQGILDSGETMETIKIWVWLKANEGIFVEEMNRVEKHGVQAAHDHAPAIA